MSFDPIAEALNIDPAVEDPNYIPDFNSYPKIQARIPAWNKGLNHFGSKENHPWYGKEHTAESKAKISKSRLGLKHSEETKEKMRAQRLGKKPPCSMEGRKHSPETIEKMRIAGLKRYGKL